MATRNLLVRAGFDATGMRSGVRQGNRYLSQFGANANSTMSNLSSNLSSTMGRIGKLIAGAFAIGAIVNFGKECVELGSNLSEVQNVVDVTFGSMANEVNEFAKNALTSFGLSETSAKKYTSTMGAMLKSMGMTTGQALEMSKTITGLSADMASFYKLDADVAFEKIRSGISGETEPLKQLGINMSVANMEAYALSQGITTAYSKMSQAEQTMLRYNYLLSVTADAQGDFARTSDSWANQTRILTEQFNALKAEIGQGLIAALTPVVKALNIVINKLRVAAGYFRAFMELIFGKQSSSGGSGMAEVAEGTDSIADSAESASDAVGGIGDAASGAGKSAKKAAKEAKGALASFDELNQLKIADSSGSGGSGGGGGLENMGGAVEVDLGESTEETDKLSSMFDGVLNQLAKMKDLFGQGFTIGFASADLGALEKAIQSVKDGFKQIFEDGTIINAFTNMLDSFALNAGKVAGAFASIGTTIATNLIGGLGKYLEQNANYIKQKLINIFDIASSIFDIVGDFSVVVADIASAFAGDTAQQITANIIGMFANGFLGATELALKFGRDVLNTITSPIIENKDLIKTSLEETLKPIESITGTLKDFVTNTFIAMGKSYDEHLKPAFDNIAIALTNLMTNLLTNYNTYILPIIDGIATKVSELFSTYIQPNIDKMIYAVGRIIEAASRILLEVIEPMIEDFNSLLGPAIGFVIDKLTDLAAMLVGELFNAFGNIADAVADVCEWFAEHKRDAEVLITLLGSLATAIGLVTIKMNAGAIAQAAITAATTAWEVAAGLAATATTAFSTAMAVLTSPITLVVAAITAVITTVVLLIRHWDEVKEAAINCWDNIVVGWQIASEWFNTTVVEPIKQFFIDLWENLKQTASACWQGIVSTWQVACNWFSTTVVEPIKAKFTEWKTTISTLATQAWTGVKNAWNAAGTWFNSTIITPIKTGFSTAWDNIKQKGIGAFNGIKDGCRSAINGIIGFINGLINKINSIGFDMPDALGGGHVGFNIPNIPRLARGGIVDKPTIAEIGEAGKEMVVPLENTSFVDKLASSLGNAVMSAMSTSLGTGGSESGQNISLEMDGTVFARSMTPYIMKEMRRLGFDF